MAADTHGGGPREETIRISAETRERLRGWGDVEMPEEDTLEELLDRAELEAGSGTWPSGDYY